MQTTEDPIGPGDGEVARLLARLSRGTTWTLTAAVPLGFNAHHPQGMVRVGDSYFLTAVEILERPVRCETPGYDRTPGAGIGHLFEFDAAGLLRRKLRLGAGSQYHPGGLDYDGRHLWVPVAEYRPNGHATVYRVDPRTLAVSERFRVADHVGCVIYDRSGRQLVGMSWGSRSFYVWSPDGILLRQVPNPEQFIDFQDCHYVHEGKAVCGGVAAMHIGGHAFQLGGLSLLDLRSLTAINTVPVTPLTPAGHALTRNPIWIEAEGNALTLQVVPDDGQATLYSYRTPVLY